MTITASAGNIYAPQPGTRNVVCQYAPLNTVALSPLIPTTNRNVIIFEPVNIIAGDLKYNCIPGAEAVCVSFTGGASNNYALVSER